MPSFKPTVPERQIIVSALKSHAGHLAARAVAAADSQDEVLAMNRADRLVDLLLDGQTSVIADSRLEVAEAALSWAASASPGVEGIRPTLERIRKALGMGARSRIKHPSTVDASDGGAAIHVPALPVPSIAMQKIIVVGTLPLGAEVGWGDGGIPTIVFPAGRGGQRQ